MVLIRPVGQEVKTPPFHGSNGSSILPRVTRKKRDIRLHRMSLFFLRPRGENRSAMQALACIAGVRILRARRRELAHVSREQKYSPQAKFPETKRRQKSRTTTLAPQKRQALPMAVLVFFRYVGVEEKITPSLYPRLASVRRSFCIFCKSYCNFRSQRAERPLLEELPCG